MGIGIRKAKTDDIAQIEGIAAAAYHRYVDIIGKKPAPMVADFPEHLKKDIVFVAEDELTGKLNGYAIIIIKTNEYWLENIAVDPAVSRQGIGSHIISHVEDFISARADQYQLYTNVKMIDNIIWYHLLNFKEVKRTTEDGFERVFFVKKLR